MHTCTCVHAHTWIPTCVHTQAYMHTCLLPPLTHMCSIFWAFTAIWKEARDPIQLSKKHFPETQNLCFLMLPDKNILGTESFSVDRVRNHQFHVHSRLFLGSSKTQITCKCKTFHLPVRLLMLVSSDLTNTTNQSLDNSLTQRTYCYN